MGSKGQEISTEAIVLRSKTWGENDLRVDFFTPTHGRMTGIARHGRKSRKRFGTVLEPMNVLQLRYEEKGGLVGLREASLVKGCGRFSTQEYERLMTGFFFLDVVRQFIPERGVDEGVYALLKGSLIRLGREEIGEVIGNFLRDFLGLSGLRPVLDRCLGCRRPFEKGRAGFHFVFREGGLYCGDCLDPSALSVEFSGAGASRTFLSFLEYQLGRPLKASRFLGDL